MKKLRRVKTLRFNISLRLMGDMLPRESAAKAQVRITRSALQALSCYFIGAEILELRPVGTQK